MIAGDLSERSWERLLSNGRVRVLGRIMDSSNAALLCTVEAGGVTAQAVLKPAASERRLHDFAPGSLARREAAAWRLSHAAGFDVVPPTVLRQVPGHGEGSLQAWVEHAPEEPPGVAVLHPEELTTEWLPILATETEDGEDVVIAHADDAALRRIMLFDLLANNADRKGGHVLYGHWAALGEARARFFAIDQGLCFHTEPKCRTVLWGFAGEPFTDEEIRLIVRTSDVAFEGLLTVEEVEALGARAVALLEAGAFPFPPRVRMPLPWPPL